MSIANKPQPTYGTALLSTAFPIRLAIALALFNKFREMFALHPVHRNDFFAGKFWIIFREFQVRDVLAILSNILASFQL